MIVMKFGGTSVGNAERILGVAKIIKNFHKKEDIIVIVSALKGTTDKLIGIFNQYKSGLVKEAIADMLNLYELHMLTLDRLRLPIPQRNQIQRTLSNLFGELSIYLMVQQEYSGKDYDYAVSFGERFSSVLLTEAINKDGSDIAQAIDSGKVIVTTNEFGNARALIPQCIKQA